ncbi:MAG: ABC transporter permease [Acidobacteriia bacterium]|nr:ABC transporter permease [Terriglobia bacterium]
MESLFQDLRYALRMLFKNPGFTAVAVLTLSLGIGANTAIFSLTDQVLFRLLPVVRPGELVILRSPGPNPGHTWSDSDDTASFSYPLYKDLRERNTVLAGVLARFPTSLNVAGDGQTERASGELVSGNYFELLGVRPALGRVLTPADESAPGANPVAVLSYGYWTRRFGGDPGILNKVLNVNGTPLTVVGVSRPGFAGIQIGQLPDIFVPITMKPMMTPNWDGLNDLKDHWVAILGRLRPGMTRPQAEAGLLPVYRSILESELPLMGLSATTKSRFLQKQILLGEGSHGRPVLQNDAQRPLLVLMAMVGLVLLIACANLANLQLAHGLARQREVAVRAALGAGRLRMVRQLLTESVLLALAGGATGLLVASWMLETFIGAIPQGLGAVGLEARLDPRVIGFTLGLSVGTAILFGLIPALRATRIDLQSTLQGQGAAVSNSLSHVRLRKGLIVSQVALTAVLLIVAGLFARSLDNLKRLSLGVRIDHVIQFSIAPELNRYTPPQTLSLFDRMRAGIGALPGVRSVSTAEVPVFDNSDMGSNITVQGYAPHEEEDMHVFKNWVGPDYFSTMGTPLIAGREFNEGDRAEAPKVAIINETMARRFFAGRNPIGGRFAFGAGHNTLPDIEIVGLVKDSKHTSLRSEIHPFVCLPYEQDTKLGGITFYVRTAMEPAAMLETLRHTVERFDPNLPLYDLKTLQNKVDESLFSDRLLTFLSLCFGVLAALLAAVGLYGVMTYTVTRRTREIGMRVALGATRENVAWLILREVARMTGVGLTIGLAAAFALGRLIESQLFGIRASDPLVFVLAAVLLAAVALLAGYLPAHRATRVDPMVALRCE